MCVVASRWWAFKHDADLSRFRTRTKDKDLHLPAQSTQLGAKARLTPRDVDAPSRYGWEGRDLLPSPDG